MVRRALLIAAVVLLCTPAAARANGDPASDYLLLQSVFLPFNAKVDSDTGTGCSSVMPNGYGFSINGKPSPAGIEVVTKLPPPGKDATKEVEGATNAIRRLAAASGIAVSSGAGGSETRDRIVIAAGAVALVALLAAIVFYRRERTPAPE